MYFPRLHHGLAIILDVLTCLTEAITMFTCFVIQIQMVITTALVFESKSTKMHKGKKVRKFPTKGSMPRADLLKVCQSVNHLPKSLDQWLSYKIATSLKKLKLPLSWGTYTYATWANIPYFVQNHNQLVSPVYQKCQTKEMSELLKTVIQCAVLAKYC